METARGGHPPPVPRRGGGVRGRRGLRWPRQGTQGTQGTPGTRDFAGPLPPKGEPERRDEPSGVTMGATGAG